MDVSELIKLTASKGRFSSIKVRTVIKGEMGWEKGEVNFGLAS